MSYRELRDDHGRVWQIWNTVPTSVAGALAEGFADGWLTFECDLEKRRLAPIPAGWDEVDERALHEMLAAARPVHRPNRAAREHQQAAQVPAEVSPAETVDAPA